MQNFTIKHQFARLVIGMFFLFLFWDFASLLFEGKWQAATPSLAAPFVLMPWFVAPQIVFMPLREGFKTLQSLLLQRKWLKKIIYTGMALIYLSLGLKLLSKFTCSWI
jgi:hypothetical protein